DRPVHPAALPFPRGGPADHELPPAALDAAHAGRRVRRLRPRDGRVPRGRARALPVLLVWRCDGSGLNGPGRGRGRGRGRGSPWPPARACAGTRTRPRARPRPMFDFGIAATEGAARAGVLKLPHGAVRTPAFMPVGTQATVKTLAPDEVEAAGADMILANTYHLFLRPGAELVREQIGRASA